MRDCTICAAKIKTLISCADTAQLICTFVFAYEDCWFSDAVAQNFIEYIRLSVNKRRLVMKHQAASRDDTNEHPSIPTVHSLQYDD